MLVFLVTRTEPFRWIDDIWLEEFRVYLLAVDKLTGKVRWKADRPDVTRSASLSVMLTRYLLAVTSGLTTST